MAEPLTDTELRELDAWWRAANYLRDLDMIYIAGPGHGGPGLVADAYLGGTYSEVYPSVTRDTEGMRKLFRQFSFPGGVPSRTPTARSSTTPA